MPTVSFQIADVVSDRDALLLLNTEYVGWVFQEIKRAFGMSAEAIVGTSVPDYVAQNIEKVCGERPPRGIFYVIRVDGELAGMCGLRCLRPGVAELKRLYVREAYRGQAIGNSALQQLLADACRFGYRQVYLDTGPFMTASHRLYAAHGFRECPAYEGVEIPPEFHPRWRFMERGLESREGG